MVGGGGVQGPSNPPYVCEHQPLFHKRPLLVEGGRLLQPRPQEKGGGQGWGGQLFSVCVGGGLPLFNDPTQTNSSTPLFSG